MKKNIVIQSAFHLEYTCFKKQMIYVFDSPGARMHIFGMDFFEKLAVLSNLKNPVPTLTIFAGKCFELSPCLDVFHFFHNRTL